MSSCNQRLSSTGNIQTFSSAPGRWHPVARGQWRLLGGALNGCETKSNTRSIMACNDEGTQFCLHGLNAIHLSDVGWYRVDARGNRADVYAQFAPPIERLAFKLSLPDESGQCTLAASFDWFMARASNAAPPAGDAGSSSEG